MPLPFTLLRYPVLELFADGSLLLRMREYRPDSLITVIPLFGISKIVISDFRAHSHFGNLSLFLHIALSFCICYNASRQERRKCSLWHAKSPGVATSGAFLFRCGKVAYALGWLPPIYLRPAICRCSRRLHLPRQRVRKTKIYSWWHTPFLYLYRGGSVAHYTIVAEMPQEAISPCLLSEP